MLTANQPYQYALCPPQHRRRVFWGVTGVHVLLVLLTALSSVFTVTPPKPTGIRVRLVTAQRSTEPPVHSLPSKQTTTSRIPPRRTVTHRKSKIRPASAIPAPTVPKHVVSWRARSAADIRKSAQLETPPKRLRAVPASPRHISASPASIAGRINRKVNNLRISAPVGETSASNADEFFAALSAVLYRLWQQPDRSSVGSGRPTVRAAVTVTSAGRLLSAKLTGASGIPAMDQSVRAALNRIRDLPAPKDFGLRKSRLIVNIVFELD